MAKPTDFADYAAGFPKDVQEVLNRIRATIKKAVPGATETISYNIPTFRFNGRILAHFGAFKTHIGFYPPVGAPAALKREVAQYAGPKGNLQFPFSRPIPYDLIERIVRSRAEDAA